MTAPEFTEHYTRFLEAKRDYWQLDHAGHFDDAIKARWTSILKTGQHLTTHPFIEMARIERDFYRRA